MKTWFCIVKYPVFSCISSMEHRQNVCSSNYIPTGKKVKDNQLLTI